jgi:NAD(P)H-dependent FMN reductase
MPKIIIVSSSIRPDRNSHRVALYFENYLVHNHLADAEILDLQKCNFPIFNEPLKHQKVPNLQALEFAEKIESAEGIIIVTPEYNGSIPASLKNAIDLLYEEWRHKPIAIATVSAGPFGGSQAMVALQFILWKMKAWTIPEMFSVPNVTDTYSELGVPKDKEMSDKLASVFIKELLWCVEADMAE